MAGGVADFWIKFTNTGTETWTRDLGIATNFTPTVAPGEVGEFRFKVRAPIARGVYRLNLRPVIDGTVWLEDQGVSWVSDVR